MRNKQQRGLLNKKEVSIKMKKAILMSIVIGLMSMFITILPAKQALAVVNCASATSADSDNDGFNDQLECTGITLMDNSIFPSCRTNPNLTRNLCLDPDSPDLFIVLVPANPSNFPANPLEFVSAPKANGGLGIAAHAIQNSQTFQCLPEGTICADDRKVTSSSTQKAIRIVEDLDVSTLDIVGAASSENQTPNAFLALATIYTGRIKKNLENTYAPTGTAVPLSLTEKYIKHTIAHETGHLVKLSPVTVRGIGYHYKTGSNYELDYSTSCSVKGSSVNCIIGTIYTATDQSGFRLK